MVAHQSPKLPVWVRVLVPLPNFTVLVCKVLFFSFKTFSKEVYLINNILKNIILFSIIVCIFFIPFLSTENSNQQLEYSEIIFLGNNNFAWPIPGYTRISSYFGKREAPTAGSSTYHKGIDIPAPEGTNLIASCDGEITFTGFLGGGGYTITLTNPDGLKISYCHVSPNYLVSKGDIIHQGQIIGIVGPKYVDSVLGNPYKDSTGRFTNGATTGCHLHIGFRLPDNSYVNPLDYLQ